MPMTTSSQQSGSKNVINKKNTKTLTILLFNAHKYHMTAYSILSLKDVSSNAVAVSSIKAV